mgnify:CR=1 FL=1
MPGRRSAGSQVRAARQLPHDAQRSAASTACRGASPAGMLTHTLFSGVASPERNVSPVQAVQSAGGQ